MEIFELKYFLGVARFENIHRASESLNVSPASLSKAVARLESELSTKLFHREGRTIRLSTQGQLLQKRASEIVQLEESTRIEITGHEGELQVVMAGSEILLTKMGFNLTAAIKKRFPSSRFEFRSTDDDTALEWIKRGEAHLALVTRDVSIKDGVASKVIEEVEFHTYVGRGHPLFPQAKAKKSVDVHEVLKHSFVSPDHPLLGKVGARQSLDGWRDDQFPRKVEFLTSSLKLIEELVVSGKAIAYLPDYFASSIDVEVLKVAGCPYTCVQKIKMIARKPKDTGWLNQIF